MNVKGIAPLFVVAAALLWSLDGLLRRSLFVLPPDVIVFYEHLLGTALLLPVLISGWLELRKLGWKGWSALGLVSLFSGLLGTLFYTAALGKVQFIQFSVVVLLQQLQPIWVILTAAVVLGERMPQRFFLWAVPAFIASYFVSFPNLQANLSTGDGTTVAALLALGAGLLWGTSTSFSKVVLGKISPLLATSLRFSLTSVLALGAIVALGHSQQVTGLTTEQWLTLAGITLSTGMVALALYYYGLRSVHASTATILELTWPLSAIFIDYALLGNSLTATQWLGTIVLLFSIYQISRLEVTSSKPA